MGSTYNSGQHRDDTVIYVGYFRCCSSTERLPQSPRSCCLEPSAIPDTYLPLSSLVASMMLHSSTFLLPSLVPQLPSHGYLPLSASSNQPISPNVLSSYVSVLPSLYLFPQEISSNRRGCQAGLALDMHRLFLREIQAAGF